MSPEDLHRALASLPAAAIDADVLVGHSTLDDAGVVRLSDELALIQTVDFFTPIVDDPYDYGQIAAANAMSDVYAMGGTPRTALNIVCWPPAGVAPEILSAILAGGLDKAAEAGCSIVGGHSIQDEEIKYGLAVTGTARPDRLLTNAAARPGEAVLLTKPLGTGILTTALKRGARTAAAIAGAVAAMKALNAAAARIALDLGASAATDVTGFGLAGHAVQLADASRVTLVLDADRLPVFADAEALGEAGHVPGGGVTNRDWFGPRVAFGDGVAEPRRIVAFDPQTSGGLLVALPEAAADRAVARLHEAGAAEAARIGRVAERGSTAVVLE